MTMKVLLHPKSQEQSENLSATYHCACALKFSSSADEVSRHLRLMCWTKMRLASQMNSRNSYFFKSESCTDQAATFF